MGNSKELTPQTKEVTIQDRKFIIASLLTCEVEDFVLAGTDVGHKKLVIENPRAVVMAGLNNAAPLKPYTEADVRSLPWQVFKELQAAILEFTGFPPVENKNAGEASAAVN
jgi:hypothetical protein